MTKEQWKSLSPKGQWDIQVAMRGPDCTNSETIKWFSTSVIRGQMKEVMRVGGTVNDHLGLVITPSYLSINSLLPKEFKKWQKDNPTINFPWVCWWNPQHFFEHVMAATHHMNIPHFTVEADVWLEAINHRTQGACEVFIKACEKEGGVYHGATLLTALKEHLIWAKGEGI